MTLSILQPFEPGSLLGVFSIPLLPCSGTFRVTAIQDRTLELQAERLQGECARADSYSLELLFDGTLRCTSKGRGWEAQGILRPMSEE